MKKMIKTAAVGLALASGIALLPSMGVAHSNGGGWASATSVTIFYASSGRHDATAVGGNLSTAEAAGNASSQAQGGGGASVSYRGTSVKGGGGAAACAGSGCN